MSKTRLLIIGALVCSLVLACSTIQQGSVSIVPRCEDYGSAWRQAASNVDAVYSSISPENCVAFLPPFDQAGWWENRMDSRRIRGEEVIRLGCTSCPAGIQDCKSPGNCGGCNYITLYYDFAKFQEDAEITAAKLALYAVDYPELIAQAIVEGRLNVGGDFQVLAEQAEVVGNWVMFDITPFVCRAVAERRNSVSIDLSLPCGPEGRARVAALGLSDDLQPTMIVEYK